MVMTSGKIWQDRLEASSRFIEQRLASVWAQADKLFAGSSHWADREIEDALSLPLAFANYRILNTTTLARFPEVVLTPNTKEAEEYLEAHRVAVNYEVRHTRMLRTMRLMHQDAHKYGYGVGEHGFESTFGISRQALPLTEEQRTLAAAGVLYRCPTPGCPGNSTFAESLGEMATPAAIAPEPAPFAAGIEAASAQAMEESLSKAQRVKCPHCGRFAQRIGEQVDSIVVEGGAYMKKGSGTFIRRSPRMTRFDPTCADLESLTWIAFGVPESLEAVKRNKDLKNISKLQATNMAQYQRLFGEESAKRLDAQRQYAQGSSEIVLLWRCWEQKTEWKEGESKFAFSLRAEGQEQALLEDEDPWRMPTRDGGSREYPLDTPPVTFMYWNVITDEQLPRSQLQLHHGLYEEIDISETIGTQHERRAIPFMLFQRAALGPTKLQALKKGIVQKFVPVEDLNGFKGFEWAPLGSDFYHHRSFLMRRAEELEGVISAEKGGAVPNITATQSQQLGLGAGQAKAWMAEGVEDAWQDAIRKRMRIIRHFYPAARWVSVAEAAPREISSEELHADVDYAIELGSTQPKDSAVRLKLRTDIFDRLIRVPGLDTQALVLWLCKSADVPRSEIETFFTGQDQVEAEIAQEVAAMFAGLVIPPTAATADLKRHVEREGAALQGPAMEQLAKADPARAQTVAAILQNHITGELRIMQGGGLTGPGPMPMGVESERPAGESQMLGTAQDTENTEGSV